MTYLRKIAMHLTIVLLTTLTVLSVLAAFLPAEGALDTAERAQRLWTSPPMIGVWCVTLGLLTVGMLAWPGVRRRPMVLAMHLGTLLVLAGMMLNSDKAHDWWNAARDPDKPANGYVLLTPEHPSDEIFRPTAQAAASGMGGMANTGMTFEEMYDSVGTLPVSVHLRDAYTKYYPPKPDRSGWMVSLVAHPADRENAAFVSEPLQRETPQLTLDSLDTPITARVTQVYSSLWLDAPTVLLADDEGGTLFPAKVGAEQPLKDGSTLRVVKYYQNIRPGRDADGEITIQDAPSVAGQPNVPAVEMLLLDEHEHERRVVAFRPGLTTHMGRPLLNDRYLPVLLTPSKARTNTAPSPMVQLELSRGDIGPVRGWFSPSAGEQPDRVRLQFLFDSEKAWTDAGEPMLMMQWQQMPQEYVAEIVLRDGEQTVASKSLRVNDPLHAAGYTFYLNSMDDRVPQVNLHVQSDTGISVIHAGMGVLLVGLFVGLWGGLWKRRAAAVPPSTSERDDEPTDAEPEVRE